MSAEERDTERGEEKPFAVERAKSGRAKCKKCKCPIEKDVVRIAKLMANPFSEGKMKAWHHVSCLADVFSKQRASTKKIDDPEEDVDGWQDLSKEDKKFVLEKLGEFDKSLLAKATNVKSPREASPSPKKRRKMGKTENVAVDCQPSTSKVNDSSDERKKIDETRKITKDSFFREFRKLCSKIAEVSAYTEKTSIIRNFLTQGSGKDGFRSDTILWCEMLLPAVVNRIYNLQSKQLIKLFARIFCEDEDEMLEDLERGDVAETVRAFFERSTATVPAAKSFLAIREVDKFLQQLSTLTKEDDQIRHFMSILSRCTGNDLKMIVRLIKHDLRINAGPKHVLNAIHEDAYAAFQASRDLRAVIERCLDISSSSTSSSRSSSASISPRVNKVALSLMTPVLPMLAEACKSVDVAMKKYPNGMLAEVKYDGERVQVHKRAGEFRYFSRSLKPVLPHKVNLFKDFIPKAFPDGDDLILDSEVLLVDNKTGQPLPFGTLGIHKKAEFKDASVCLFVFDCIYYNGEVLMNKTMQERRQILKDRMKEIPNRIVLSEVQEVYNPRDLAEMIAKVLKMGLEGLVLKETTSKYEPGKRHWLKVKKDYLFDGAMADTADLVVLGAWYGTGQKGGMMSVFLMGCYDEERDRWLTVTKVHTGHDDATLERLQGELDMIKIGKDPNRVPRWLSAKKPMIPDFVAKDPKNQPVWEITGAEFTNQGVHTADGISIRFPRVTRIRSDKDWSTATSLKELRELFQKSSESMDFSLLLASDNAQHSDVKPNVASLDRFLEKKADSEKLHNRKRTVPDDEKDEKKCKIKTEISSPDVKDFSDSIPGQSLMALCKIKKEDDSEDSNVKFIVKNPVKKEVSVKREVKKENRAEYYSFVDKDYIEYSAAGSPLNWIEGRKPPKGLPSDAKRLIARKDTEWRSRTILKNVRACLADDVTSAKRDALFRSLKTLGATILTNNSKSTVTHVVHGCKEILSTTLQEYADFPKDARHVNISWVESSARESKIQDVAKHAVQLAANYCTCNHQ